ncbi:MAG: hypothetical protein ACREDS_04285 [Limisphaerales bacterium]
MKMKIFFTLLAIAGGLGLTGCKPATTTLTGQVFIVTRSAENVKLGDVQILIVAKTNVTNFIQSKYAEIESEIADKQLQITNASQKASAAFQALDDATKAFQAYQGNVPYKTNADYLKMKDQLAEVSQLRDGFRKQLLSLLQQEANVINAAASDDELDQDTLNALHKRESAAEESWELETNAVENLQEKIDAIESFADDKSNQMLADAEDAESNATNAQLEVESLQAGFDNFPSAQDYFNDFSPVASQETKTDSDGKFSFSYPRTGAFTIFATAQRMILGKTETYYWLVDAPTGIPKAQILLSNDNLATVDSDNYFTLKPKELSEVSTDGQ